MGKIIAIVFAVIITSFYFFPFEFVFMPAVNTKMAMAGFGLILLLVNLAKGNQPVINRDYFILSVWALLVSVAGLCSVAFNGTYDYTYASYLISMWVWTAAAYVVVNLIRFIHGSASAFVVCNYLIAVCLIQCFLALLIDSNPAFKDFVDRWVVGLGFVDMDKITDSGRLYGIGASVDVAGTRFAAILVMISFLSIKIAPYKEKNKILLCYIISFLCISIIGNMMSRTTTLGIVLSFLYVGYVSRLYLLEFAKSSRKIIGFFAFSLLLLIPFVVYKYNTDVDFYYKIRFAFEGFFSLAEKGEWDVHSNEILKEMYVFPDNLKTWIIGDGYFENPYYSEPYYVGPNWAGYYKATDVGYLRFIYYFGLLGLGLFSYFMYKVGKTCAQRFPNYNKLFIIILILNFIIWFKVSTDIFLIFALFLMIGEEENDKYEQYYFLNRAGV